MDMSVPVISRCVTSSADVSVAEQRDWTLRPRPCSTCSCSSWSMEHGNMVLMVVVKMTICLNNDCYFRVSLCLTSLHYWVSNFGILSLTGLLPVSTMTRIRWTTMERWMPVSIMPLSDEQLKKGEKDYIKWALHDDCMNKWQPAVEE